MTIADIRPSYREKSAPKPGTGLLLTLRHRVWPATCLSMALIANAIWIGLLGYVLIKLL